MPDKVIMTAATPDRIGFQGEMGTVFLANKIGIKGVPKPDANDIKKLTDLMAKTKKSVEFVASFDGTTFSYFARVGSNKMPIESVNIAADSSLDLDKVLDNMVINGIATKDQAIAFHKAHPDQKALAALKSQITEIEANIKQEQTKLATLKKQYSDMGGK